MLRVFFKLAILAVAAGCSDGSGAAGGVGGADTAGGAGAPTTETSVELGVPGGPDGLDFLPLADGAELRLQSFGQGGTHLLMAVRCVGFGKRAFVSATLRNLVSGVEVAEPEPARPQLLDCTDDGVCSLVPYLVHASGIAETSAQRSGLAVRLTVRVRGEAGVNAQGSREAVLSTADL